jgi:hypothetical protein
MARTTWLITLAILCTGSTALGRRVAHPDGTCDEPSAPCVAAARSAPLPPRELRVSLSVQSGLLSATALMGGSTGPAAYVGGDLRLLWSRVGKRLGFGLRLSGSKCVAMRYQGDVSGGEISFLFEAYNFWVSPGLGVARYANDSDDDIVLPELHTAIGYDVPLGAHVALRFTASVSTMVIFTRAQLGAGLAVRF